MNGIERLRDLVAAGEKAPSGRCDPVMSLKTGWKIGRIRDHTARPLSGDDDAAATSFACDALNARQAISDVLALVEAVGRWRKHGRAPRFDKELMEAYEKLTSADAQEGKS